MDEIAKMEARVADKNIRSVFESIVTNSDESVSFYTGFPGKDTLQGEL